MAFDINGFGGGFSGFDSGKVRAEGGGGLEDTTALNARISGEFASDAQAGYVETFKAEKALEAAKAFKQQQGGGLGGIFGPLAGTVAGSFLGGIGGKVGGAIGGNIAKGLS